METELTDDLDDGTYQGCYKTFNIVEKNNKLIAEFMGAETYEGIKYGILSPNKTHISVLKFHSSWDWLMPVLKKCRKLRSYKMEGIDKGLKLCDISITYYATIEFIEWYNTNLNKQQ